MNRLALARTLAWSLLFGGWLGLGGLTRSLGPGGWATLAPLALWLLTAGCLAHALASRALPAWAVRAGLLAAGGLAALSLAKLGPLALWPLAVAWGGLLVLASRVVRLLRAPAATGSPLPAASVGAGIALLIVGDTGAISPGVLGAGLVAASALLALLMPAQPKATGRPGCRSGLFDCSLAWPAPAQWREPAQWPLLAAGMAMLPMMAAIGLMSEWCAGQTWASPRGIAALHLAAMLLPAWCVRLAPRWLMGRLAGTSAALLFGGALAGLGLPGAAGAMAAMMLQASAWGLVWGAWVMPDRQRQHVSPQGGLATSAGASALAVLMLGAGLGAAGPRAWWCISLLLATIAGLGWGRTAWHSWMETGFRAR